MPSGKIIRLIKEDDHYDGCNSFNGFSATNAIKGSITTIWPDILVKVNGVPPVNEKTVPISSKPNDPWLTVSSLRRPPSANCVIENSSEISTTITTCSVGVSASNPSETPTKNAQTVVTSTNQTLRYDQVEIIVSRTTSADGENVTSAEKRSTWRPTSATFNDSSKM